MAWTSAAMVLALQLILQLCDSMEIYGFLLETAYWFWLHEDYVVWRSNLIMHHTGHRPLGCRI